MEKEPIHVGFLYPVIEGKIYVGQRGTDPYKGFYGPIGGKSEEYNEADYFPYVKQYPAVPHVPKSDVSAKECNREIGHIAALREFYEEVFQIKFIKEEISNLFKIGSISDFYKGNQTKCQFYLATVTRKDFNLSPRELIDIKPLELVSQSDLFPLSKASLFGLKCAIEKKIIKNLSGYESYGLENQIPNFDENEIKQIMESKMTTISDLKKIL